MPESLGAGNAGCGCERSTNLLDGDLREIEVWYGDPNEVVVTRARGTAQKHSLKKCVVPSLSNLNGGSQ
jgi:hypothetical protein